MPRDAKLGFVIGLGLVVFVAAAFFKKGAATAQHPGAPAAPAAVTPATPPPSEQPSPASVPVTKSPSPEPPLPIVTPVATPRLVPN
jgi:hypothetical protein